MPGMRAGRRDRERVASVIQRRRVESGLTQEQLAQVAGVSLRTVQNAEAAVAEISPLTRSRLEQALGYSRGFLSELYLTDHVPVEHDGYGLLGLEVTKVLNHPDLTPQMRKAVVEQLRKVQDDFAHRAAEFFGLNDSRRTDEEP